MSETEFFLEFSQDDSEQIIRVNLSCREFVYLKLHYPEFKDLKHYGVAKFRVFTVHQVESLDVSLCMGLKELAKKVNLEFSFPCSVISWTSEDKVEFLSTFASRELNSRFPIQKRLALVTAEEGEDLITTFSDKLSELDLRACNGFLLIVEDSKLDDYRIIKDKIDRMPIDQLNKFLNESLLHPELRDYAMSNVSSIHLTLTIRSGVLALVIPTRDNSRSESFPWSAPI